MLQLAAVKRLAIDAHDAIAHLIMSKLRGRGRGRGRGRIRVRIRVRVRVRAGFGFGCQG